MNKLQVILHQMYTFVHTLDSLIGNRVLSKDRIEDEIDYRNDVINSLIFMKNIIKRTHESSLDNEIVFCNIMGEFQTKFNNISWYFDDMYENIQKLMEYYCCSEKSNIHNYNISAQCEDMSDMMLLQNIFNDVYESIYYIDAHLGNKTLSHKQFEFEKNNTSKIIHALIALQHLSQLARESSANEYCNIMNAMYIELSYITTYFEHLNEYMRVISQNYPLSEKFIRDNS